MTRAGRESFCEPTQDAALERFESSPTSTAEPTTASARRARTHNVAAAATTARPPHTRALSSSTSISLAVSLVFPSLILPSFSLRLCRSNLATVVCMIVGGSINTVGHTARALSPTLHAMETGFKNCDLGVDLLIDVAPLGIFPHVLTSLEGARLWFIQELIEVHVGALCCSGCRKQRSVAQHFQTLDAENSHTLVVPSAVSERVSTSAENEGPPGGPCRALAIPAAR